MLEYQMLPVRQISLVYRFLQVTAETTYVFGLLRVCSVISADF